MWHCRIQVSQSTLTLVLSLPNFYLSAVQVWTCKWSVTSHFLVILRSSMTLFWNMHWSMFIVRICGTALQKHLIRRHEWRVIAPVLG